MSTNPTQPSRSDVQLATERLVREILSGELEVDLVPARVELAEGVHVDVDCVGPGESVLVEVFAHQGPLKGGQRHKIQGDVLKLATLGVTRPGSRLILALCDQVTAAGVTGWLAHAMNIYDVDLIVVELPAELREKLLATQAHQRMENARP